MNKKRIIELSVLSSVRESICSTLTALNLLEKTVEHYEHTTGTSFPSSRDIGEFGSTLEVWRDEIDKKGWASGPEIDERVTVFRRELMLDLVSNPRYAEMDHEQWTVALLSCQAAIQMFETRIRTGVNVELAEACTKDMYYENEYGPSRVPASTKLADDFEDWHKKLMRQLHRVAQGDDEELQDWINEAI